LAYDSPPRFPYTDAKRRRDGREVAVIVWKENLMYWNELEQTIMLK